MFVLFPAESTDYVQSLEPPHLCGIKEFLQPTTEQNKKYLTSLKVKTDIIQTIKIAVYCIGTLKGKFIFFNAFIIELTVW